MYYFLNGTRMVQNLDNIKNSTYTLYNNRLDEQIEISEQAASLLRNCISNSKQYISNDNEEYQNFFDELSQMGFLKKTEKDDYNNKNVYFATHCQARLPLTSLSIELVDGCNLRCKHCYGAFSECHKINLVPYNWILNNIDELNSLHVQNIALTGGEATLHPQFLKIVQVLLENGFNLCIFTNGYTPDIIEILLKKFSKYKFEIKVSLDGTKDIHNWIRGRNDAYDRTMKTIDLIYKYSNITLYISTVILRQNTTDISKLKKFLNEHYPMALHTIDIGFPMGNANKEFVFGIEDWDSFYDIISATEENPQKIVLPQSRRIFRCTGGISQCTLMPSGQLKICNAACDPRFYFKYNVFDKGLKKTWTQCGFRISKMRHEKAKKTKDCKKCTHKAYCSTNDCRVLAWVYAGDMRKSNPLTCKATMKRRSLFK